MTTSVTNNTRRFQKRGFTLIELLTVIAIIGILAAILVPVIGRVRMSAKTARCTGNVRAISQAFMAYAADNKNKLPPCAPVKAASQTAAQASQGIEVFPTIPNSNDWDMVIAPYAMKKNSDKKNDTVFRCPSDNKAVDGTGTGLGYGMNQTVYQIYVGNTRKSLPLATLPNPSRTILVSDSGAGGTGANAGRLNQQWIGVTNANTLDLNLLMTGMAFLHNVDGYQNNLRWSDPAQATGGIANVGMADGSVRSLRAPLTPEKQEEMRQMLRGR